MIDNDRRLNYLIIFLRKLRGMKYTLCLEEPKNDGPPLWNQNNKLPSYKIIYNSGSACVGLVNMIRRKQKLNIPALNKKFVGGTESWFKYLKGSGRLIDIDLNDVYPKGSMLIQNYNPNDQGHVAIITLSSKQGIMNSKIIHSVSGKFKEKNYNSCVEEQLKDYPYYSRFSHVCLPEDWIFKN